MFHSTLGNSTGYSTRTALKPASYREQNNACEHITLLEGRVGCLVKFTGTSRCSYSGLNYLAQTADCLYPMHTLSPFHPVCLFRLSMKEQETDSPREEAFPCLLEETPAMTHLPSHRVHQLPLPPAAGTSHIYPPHSFQSDVPTPPNCSS